MTTEITFNSGQSSAIAGLTDFLLSSSPNHKTLAGSAGTGKTSCMREVGRRVQEKDFRLLFTAPTNKATKVLREATGAECMTIFKALGLILEPSGMIREVTQREGELPIESFDGVVVDEASMINNLLMSFILRSAKHRKLPFIFLGDSCQLPPVNEPESPVWSFPVDYHLTQVMRFDNQILKLATQLREFVKSPHFNLVLTEDNANGEGVWKMPISETMRQAAQSAASSRGFQDGTCKCIAWRNVEVDRMNAIIRAALGTQDLSLPFSPGDRVIARSPCLDNSKPRKTLLHTDDEATVTAITVAKHPWHPEYECFIADLKNDSDDTISIWTVTPQSQVYLSQELKRLADDAKKNPRNWRQFWALKEAFHEVSLAYAITAHRSQGSTYQDVYVNFFDILRNPNRQEAAKCLYVACSRASKRLFLGG
jgi:ATP-dependent exoDNAse (exonuclease V) alpha subunit